MSRKQIVAGNWKMNTVYASAQDLALGVISKLEDNLPDNTEVIFSPPFPFLKLVADATVGVDGVYTAAQNISDKEVGAFTGEVSAEMVKSVGADYVLIGHSERRAYFNETDSIMAEKIAVALKNKLNPIFCCGESLEERKSGKYLEVIERQVSVALCHLNQAELSHVVIAYEPVWAIGTGETASPEQAQEVHAFIRKTIQEHYDESAANSLSILYGGSCKPSNATELFAQKDIDGGLIGGASLSADDFVQIIHSF